MTVLTSVQIRNFQSLSSVDVDLAPFTVFVGPSSSGKSAFFRAMKTLAENQRGHAFISHGEKVCAISGDFGYGKVTLTRGKTTADNSYEILLPDGKQDKWTKMAGTTPEEISQFMQIESKNSINMVGQFDTPYLLSSPASEVARVLGDLTNVRVVFEAAGEANRRKKSTSGVLKTRQGDLETAQEKIESFSGLEAQVKAIESAEESLNRLQKTEADKLRLGILNHGIEEANEIAFYAEKILAYDIPNAEELSSKLETINALEGVHEQIKTAAKQLKSANSTLAIEIPTTDRLSELVEEHLGLSAFQGYLKRLKADYLKGKADEEKYQQEVVDAQQAYIDALHEVGVCPTCGQDTKDVH